MIAKVLCFDYDHCYFMVDILGNIECLVIPGLTRFFHDRYNQIIIDHIYEDIFQGNKQLFAKMV